MQSALAYNSPEVFYQFLTSCYLPTYHQQVLRANKGLPGTMALVHQIDGTTYFITPRKIFAEVYAKWLGEHGAVAPWTSESKPETTLQRRLQEAGIPFRGEKNNPATWRYAFYREDKKTLDCLGLPIASLPEQVQMRLNDLLGTPPADLAVQRSSEAMSNQEEGGKAL